jgi:hypothetical protein
MVACLLVSILVSTAILQNASFVMADERDCFSEFDLDECEEAGETLNILLDAQPPTIVAPPDIKVVAEEAPLLVDIGKPKVSDGVDLDPVVTNDAPKDLLFQFGTTVIVWKATDKSGNWAVDYQFVTVVKHPSPTLPFEPITEPQRNVAALKLDPIPSSVLVGKEVLITGKLIDANTGAAVQGVRVNIFDHRPLDLRVLGKAKTDDEGKFNFLWYATPTVRGKDRPMSIFAEFEGTPAYANTVSYNRSIMIEVERLTLDLFYKKQNFGSGERVVILAAFKTFGDKLIDPDELVAKFDGKEVSMIRKSTGIYEYMSLPNTKSAHLFTVRATKFIEGNLPFGSVVEAVTIR